MSTHPNQPNRPRPQSDFLVDTENFQGISRDFAPVRGLATKSLKANESLQSQWRSAESLPICAESLFAEFHRLEIVIAGWMDQDVLEIHSVLQGDADCLAQMLNVLDVYRPAQNGDICFYLADLKYNKILATTISFEDNALSAALYHRTKP